MINKFLCFMWGHEFVKHVWVRPTGESFGGWYIVDKYLVRDVDKCKHCGEIK